MKSFEARECRSGPWIARCRGEPSHTQQLSGEWKSCFTITEGKANGMNSMRVDDSEIIPKRRLGTWANVSDGMA
jgi:hypothetical protein